MALSGDFRAMSAPELLQFLSLHQKTGTLHLSNGDRTLTLVIGDGRLLSSASSDPHFQFGAYLQRSGYLNAEERARAIQVQSESQMSIGTILVQIGVLTKAELMRLLRAKAEEEVCDLFKWTDAEFVFEPDVLPSLQMHPLQLDLLGILMEASRKRDETVRVAAPAAPVTKPAPVPAAAPAPPAQPLYYAVQGRGSSLKYHAGNCRKGHPKPSQSTVSFRTREEAEAAGLRPCLSCRP